MNKWIPSEEETFSCIGQLLLMTQDAERSISTLIGIIYPKGQPSWDEIEKLNKNTLGALITKLKERIEMNDAFVRLLEKFLKHRNMFIHNLKKQSWFDINSKDGRDRIWKFLEPYFKLLWEVLHVVTAAIFKHFEKVGMPETEYHRKLNQTGYLNLIKSYYPKSDVAFKSKKQ
jgi:hypothetical protein